jgi:hypothetical protein
MTVERHWVRITDAIDLMLKSRWDINRAKITIADALAHNAMRWRSSWARFFNPETGKMEVMTSVFNRKLMDSPAGFLFSLINKNPDAERSKLKVCQHNLDLADWNTGFFSATYHTAGGVHESDKVWIEGFFRMYDLCVSKSDLLPYLTADVIISSSKILQFDGTSLARVRGDQLAQPSVESPKDYTRRHASRDDLSQWWNTLGDLKETKSISDLWAASKVAFPENEITRRSIENLAGPRKRGRKAIPQQ